MPPQTQNDIPSYNLEGPCYHQSAVCTPILRALPGWFGIEEAIRQYTAEIDNLPTFLARQAGDVVGFLTIKQHYPVSAEILVMGVLPSAHRQGIGGALLRQAQGWLRAQDVQYLQVKTLGPSNPDENYARTRAFYLALGFQPLEELTQIWDANNPCLILVKRL